MGCWLTEEKEIENYIPRRIFKNLIEDKYDGKLTLQWTSFKKLKNVTYKSSKGDSKSLHYAYRKPHYARIIAKYFDLEMFEEMASLKKEINKIVSAIKGWNEIAE